MTRAIEVDGWSWFTNLLEMNCGPDWVAAAEELSYQQILAKAIHVRCPNTSYDEVLYRVQLIYEAL